MEGERMVATLAPRAVRRFATLFSNLKAGGLIKALAHPAAMTVGTIITRANLAL